MLNNYKKEPREENWQDIKRQLDEEHAYEKIGLKFDNFSQVPSNKNWSAIQKKMQTPEPTYSRRIIAVAASLAMLFFIISEGNNYPTYDFTSLAHGMELNDELSFDICKASPIVTLDILKPVVKRVYKQAQKRKKKKETKPKRLLDVILADDDNINSEVDSLLIAKLLSPAYMLPDESMSANKDGIYYYHQGDSYKSMYELPVVDYTLKMPLDSQGRILLEVSDGVEF